MLLYNIQIYYKNAPQKENNEGNSRKKIFLAIIIIIIIYILLIIAEACYSQDMRPETEENHETSHC